MTYRQDQRALHAKQLQKLVAHFAADFGGDVEGLKPHTIDRHDGRVLDADARQVIVAAEAILATARAALRLRQGRDGPEPVLVEAPRPRVGNGGAQATDTQREVTGAYLRDKRDALGGGR